ALEKVSGGRAGNGTNQSTTGHFAKKVLDDSCPTERPKWAGSRRGITHHQCCDALTFEPRHSLVKEQPTCTRKTPAAKPPGSLAHVVPSNTGESAECYAAD